MQTDPLRDVVVIGESLPYEDGVEDSLLDVLEGVRDRSSTSDELAAHIVDWPTRYHFSRLRRNLFEPFRFHSGLRVLEIGCGLGANLVAIAETGAEVVGVEGSLARARAARVRTLAHSNVTVFAGDVFELPDLGLFDVVVMVGVLEYSSTGAGGGSGPSAMLVEAAARVKPDGVLLLAIENQIGLKYLLSHPEDHLAIPWIGLEGYPGPAGPRTWSRAVLGSMLGKAGLVDQEWLYPFPDYKLPTIVARDRLFRSEPGRHLLRQFVRNPVGTHAGSAIASCDVLRAFEVMLDAEVGPDTANSFLVAASRQDGLANEFVGDSEAWISSGERLQSFRSQREVVAGPVSGYFVRTITGPNPAEMAEISWLRNLGNSDQPVHLGECLEDAVLRALEACDEDALVATLREYEEFLDANRAESGLDETHPFFIDASRPALPGDFIDATFKNLIRDESPVLHFVDREWAAGECVDKGLIRVRSYVELAIAVATSGISTPWSSSMTVGDLALSLARLSGDGWTSDVLSSFIAAECELQRLVSGNPSNNAVEAIVNQRLVDFIPKFPVLSMIRRLRGAERVLGSVKAELDSAKAELDSAKAELDSAQQQCRDQDERYSQLADEFQLRVNSSNARTAQLESELAQIAEERNRLRLLVDEFDDARRNLANEVEVLRRSRAYRLGRGLTAPLRIWR